MSDPLAASRYLLRNPRRVLPAIAVQALVTALILSVVTPLTAFDATIEANIAPLRVYSGITPMRKNTFDEALTRLIEANPAMASHARAKSLWMRTPGVVGELWTTLLALEPKDQADLLGRVGNHLADGHLPVAGSDGVAIHRDVSRARGLAVGDAFGRLVDPEDPTPGRFVVTGIVEGPARIGVVDLQYASIPDFVLSRVESFEVVYAKPGRKAESDAYLAAAKDAEGHPAFKVWDEAFWRRRTDKMLENLPLLLNAIVGSLTVVIALVVVLLNLISFQARADEFALLIAVGRTRGRLIRKIVVESAACAAVAWALGLGLGTAFVALYDRLVLAPKAILIRYFDSYPVALASVLPLVAAAASAAVLAWRLRDMDPVSVIQRRNA